MKLGAVKENEKASAPVGTRAGIKLERILTGDTSFDTRSTRLSQVLSVVRFLDDDFEMVTTQSRWTATSSPPLARPAPLLAMMMIVRQT